MNKFLSLGFGVLTAVMMTGCAVKSSSSSAPAFNADKGSYFTQDKEKSLAANLVAFSGYRGLISDRDMPSDLRAGLDFTSGAYMGFNGFGTIFGAGGVGLLSMVSSNTLPYKNGAIVVMVKTQPNEKYNDLTVAERAIESSFAKADINTLSPVYTKKTEVQSFLANKDMSGVKCHKPSVFDMTDTDVECDYGDSDLGLAVIFGRPATGQEFPELGLLPAGNYSVMLVRNIRYPVYQLRDDAWAATYSSDGYMKFKDMKLPFVSPDKSGKRIAFTLENGKDKVIYK